MVVRKHTTAKGVWGHAPQKFWEFRGYEVASETISGPKRCFSKARRHAEFYMHEHLPFLPVAPLVSAFWSFANLTSHILHRSLGERKIIGRLSLSHSVRSHLVLCCNMSPRCVRAMGICQALALLGDAKQAIGEGKSGPVETGLTGLTGLVAMALTWFG